MTKVPSRVRGPEAHRPLLQGTLPAQHEVTVAPRLSVLYTSSQPKNVILANRLRQREEEDRGSRTSGSYQGKGRKGREKARH